ncbi:MAG: SsrA-binding protein SmpB [Bacteroidia bacterium]|nr:SsrA-binding protein SmpB [Bacteroidia bacterium]
MSVKKDKERFSKKIEIVNRQARYLYEILEKYTAGIVLTGTEIKSLRMGKASIAEGYIFIDNGEVWLKNSHIAEYTEGTYNNHDPKRLRKLLLQKKEILKLKQKLEQKGLTIIPLKIFFNQRGYAKLEIALARGKKLHDKREDIKKKDAIRELKNKE